MATTSYLTEEQRRQQMTPSVVPSGGAAPSAALYSGLQGLSQGTQSKLGTLQQGFNQGERTNHAQQQLGRYEQGYTQGQAVTDAQNYLNQLRSGKPGAYNSRYADQLDSIYQQIMNRPDFRYDLNGDMLYQQYKDQYTRNGQQAMMDAMGQAAALTGGYGSSYAQAAGNQAYQQYLTQLNGVIPELYDRAYNHYNQQGQALLYRYQLAAGADATDYGRYQDTLSQWNLDYQNATAAEQQAYQRDYGQYTDMLNYWANAYQQGYQNDYNAYTDALNYWTQLAAQENSDYYAAMQARWQQEDRDAAAAAAAAAASRGRSGGGGSTGGSGNSNSALGGLSYYERSLIDNAKTAYDAADKQKVEQLTQPKTSGTPNLMDYVGATRGTPTIDVIRRRMSGK